MPRYPALEIVRAASAALVAILLAGACARLLPGSAELPWLVAPMGASAVLLLAVPASPLAQPWPVLGGNLVSTCVGLLAHAVVGDLLLAAAVAVGASIALMMALRCLHPPGGACALLAATAPAAVHEHWLEFVAVPVAVNTVVLVVVAVAVHTATGVGYPHRAPRVAAPEPAHRAIGVLPADVDAALQDFGQRLDVLPDDVVALVRAAEAHALDRRLGSLPVAEVMNTDVATLQPFESLFRARTVIAQRHAKSVPVVDADRHVVGIVSITDLFTRDLVELEPVSTVMRTDVVTMRADAPVAEMVPLMTHHGFRQVPVVDADDRLVGYVTRGEVIAVLHRALLGEDLRP